jgi:hypothetical protein
MLTRWIQDCGKLPPFLAVAEEANHLLFDKTSFEASTFLETQKRSIGNLMLAAYEEANKQNKKILVPQEEDIVQTVDTFFEERAKNECCSSGCVIL